MLFAQISQAQRLGQKTGQIHNDEAAMVENPKDSMHQLGTPHRPLGWVQIRLLQRS
jgi:hypothetical protein